MQPRRLPQGPEGELEHGAPREPASPSSCDHVASVLVAVRAALAEGRPDTLRALAHPLAVQEEQIRLARRFGGGEAAGLWSRTTSEVEAVRLVGSGLAEVYEHARHHPSATSLRLVATVERVRGEWRITELREAGDERITAVLLRGAPPEEPIDPDRWMRAWTRSYGPTARMWIENGRGMLEHPTEGWRASVRSGSGRELSRALGATGSHAQLLDKQPAATHLALVPALDAHKRTDQLRWMARAVATFDDASSVWVPSAAKAIPFSTWLDAVHGTLELGALTALWLRTQRQRGAWITRGMTSFMLPELEVSSDGLTVGVVRALLRDAAGRLLRHHQARIDRRLGARAPAVPAAAPVLYTRTSEGLFQAVPAQRLDSALDLGDTFAIGDVAAVLSPGRRGPRQGESYGRWGSVALRVQPQWWSSRAA